MVLAWRSYNVRIWRYSGVLQRTPLKLRIFLQVLNGHSPNVPQRTPLTKRPPSVPHSPNVPQRPPLTERPPAYPNLFNVFQRTQLKTCRNMHVLSGHSPNVLQRTPTSELKTCIFLQVLSGHSPNVPQRTPLNKRLSAYPNLVNVFQRTPLKTTCIPAGFEWTITKRPTAYPNFRTKNVHIPAGFEWTFTKRPTAYPNFPIQNYMYSCRFWVDIHQTSPSVPHSPNVPQRPPT